MKMYSDKDLNLIQVMYVAMMQVWNSNRSIVRERLSLTRKEEQKILISLT